MKNLASITLAALVTLAGNLLAQTSNPLRTFFSPAPTDSGMFGRSVTATNGNIFIGAPGDSAAATAGGAVHLFDEATRNYIRTFQKQNPVTNDQFGFSVAAAGNKVLIGAPRDDAGAPDAGAAYLFEVDTGNQLNTFRAQIPADTALFGYSVATIGGNALVGAPRNVNTATVTGAVYLFDDTTGAFIQMFTNQDTAASGLFDFFGFSIAALGNNILIGAPLAFALPIGISAGAAYLFDGTTGQHQHSFQSSTPTFNNGFGVSVAFIGNNVLVGETGNDTGAHNAGAVCLFNGTTGARIRTFQNPYPHPDDAFGAAIAAIGSNVLIGTPGENNSTGAVYLFDSATGDLLHTFENPTPNVGDKFGSAIAVDGDNIIIGAPFDDTAAPDAGASYLFSTVPIGSLAITSPRSGLTLLGESVLVTGKFTATGGIPPLDTSITVNGISAVINRGQFIAPVPLVIGSNDLIARFRIKNSQGDSSVHFETVNVVRVAGEAETRVDFESQVFATRYGEQAGQRDGDLIFAENYIPITVHGFKETPTGSTFFFFCRVDSSFDGFGAGQIMRANNINLKFDFTWLRTPVNKLTFDFIDQGGSENIAVNDGAVLIGNLPIGTTNIAPGLTLEVDTVHVSGGEIGKATLIGPIRNLLIGGQEFWIDNISAQDTLSCRLTIQSPLNNATLCSDSVTVRSVAQILGGEPPFTIEYEVNGISATFADTNLAVKVPLNLGANDLIATSLIATSTVTDNRGQSAVGVDSVRVERVAVSRNLVINEILYDPNNADLDDNLGGTERIEIKNIGATPFLLDSTLALWIRRGDLDTYWTFRQNRVTLAPNQLFVIHWLGEGEDDGGNVFTGVPDDGGNAGNAQDGFWGNNSVASNIMTIGGADNSNTEAFTIALMQQIFPGDETGFNDPCNMVDFVQICGRVAKSESLAVEAGLWRAGDSLACTPEGNSLSREDDDQYTENPNPSFGSDNVSPSVLPEKHLLISEVCIRPDNSEFVEIYNPSDSSISLRDYYLTDHVTRPNDAAYTRLVKGADSLQIQAGDFFVQFPATAQIGPRQFQTIAFSADSFFARYNVKPIYEISDDDTAVANMEIIKLGAGNPGLDDNDGALILLKWVKSDSSDLVQDADYVVWGEQIIVPAPNLAPVKGIGEIRVTTAVGSVDAPFLGVNKTGVGIDGLDGNNIKSYYNNETRTANQRPIANTAHAERKSWQRANFLEANEKKAGGNGISGHDETSENLTASFIEAAPTPNGTSPLDGLVYSDGSLRTIEDDSTVDHRLKNVGFPNRIINPGETVKMNIQLQNLGAVPTGTFFTILRPRNSFVTMKDSTSDFNSIAVGDSGLSLNSYVFEVTKTLLRDSLDFALILIQKFSGSTIAKQNQPAELSAVMVQKRLFATPIHNITFDITFNFTVTPIRSDSSNLTFGATIKNVGTLPSNDTRISGSRSADTTIIKKVLSGEQNPGTINLNDTRVLLPINFVLVDTFKSQPTSFDLAFSWQHTATQRLQYAVTIATLVPDTFEVAGKMTYFNDDTKPIPDIIVSLFRHASLVPDTTDTTDVSGNYSFHLLGDDAGRYKIIANRTQLPSAPNMSIFTGADRDSVQALRNRAPSSTKNDEVFKRLAADVHVDSMLTNVDTCAVGALARNQLPVICSSSIRQGWAFKDAITPVKNDKFFRASDTLNLILNNYSISNLNFAGIIYGDVDSSAGRFFILPTSLDDENFLTSTPTKTAQNTPEKFFLAQNYPNPFNPATRIEYGLPKDTHVVLEIFNMVGQLVYTGVDLHQKAGYYQIDWAGIEQSGKPVPAGLYLMRLRAGKFSQVRKLLLVK